MAKRTMLVTLEIVVADLSDTDREEAAEIDARMLDDEEEPAGVPTLSEYENVDELAGVLQEGISPDTCAEMFGGSGLFVQFESALLIGAEWVTPLIGDEPASARSSAS